ncbi:grasp-with-spasm system SPASM domain peptide maturase [Chryseobacterium panacisoli]|uniref:Grasp-with-spasm system SPASM domain peptide maturase n=1 Tax=Chryseobacterium panacisoli TaxID=1807141 RepID=A0A5D8ZGI2_9FLAO|nr:grasp-with-spasm system SPASM domain peptide maturase [Chryseobacterium panacisoli]TZF93183.1 grasp-with-spasm system SPASM domain peptide maturase [Chryseobacterium panacisoli]
MKHDYFRVYTNCIVTKGYTRSLISDIQRDNSEFIPNSLADIIERLNQKESLASIYKDYGEESKPILDEYFDFLLQEEYGFYCSNEEFDMFIDLDLHYQNPDRISNMIIEIKKNELSSLKGVVTQAERLGCKFIALVCYESLDPDDFDKIKVIFDNTIVSSVEIISQYSDRINENTISELSTKFERLTSLFLFNAPPKMSMGSRKKYCKVVFSQKKYTNFSFCGGISSDHFQTNLPKVLEALNHNSCLNKKIAVDINGNIKNCPAMPESFGNIKDISLNEAVKHQNFEQYWNVTKDVITGCKDCEFRYICTDCRAFTERSDSNENLLDLSKPLKCGYDPYTGEWEEWSANELKQKAINYYKQLP